MIINIKHFKINNQYLGSGWLVPFRIFSNWWSPLLLEVQFRHGCSLLVGIVCRNVQPFSSFI